MVHVKMCRVVNFMLCLTQLKICKNENSKGRSLSFYVKSPNLQMLAIVLNPYLPT